MLPAVLQHTRTSSAQLSSAKHATHSPRTHKPTQPVDAADPKGYAAHTAGLSVPLTCVSRRVVGSGLRDGHSSRAVVVVDVDLLGLASRNWASAVGSTCVGSTWATQDCSAICLKPNGCQARPWLCAACLIPPGWPDQQPSKLPARWKQTDRAGTELTAPLHSGGKAE